MAADAVAEYMDALPGWTVEEGKVVHKAFRFNNFANALAFVNRIGDVAEEQDHHPDLELGWGRVVVNLSTHSVGGLSPNDFILAARRRVADARRGRVAHPIREIAEKISKNFIAPSVSLSNRGVG